jgi:hypothetical protein
MSQKRREIPLEVQLSDSCKKKLESLARIERRSVEHQAIRLIESGLAVFEQGDRRENDRLKPV